MSPIAYIQDGFLERGAARKGAPKRRLHQNSGNMHPPYHAAFVSHVQSLLSGHEHGLLFSSLFTSTELEFQEKKISNHYKIRDQRGENWLCFQPGLSLTALSSCPQQRTGQRPAVVVGCPSARPLGEEGCQCPLPPCWGSLPRWKQPGEEKYVGPSSVLVRLKDQHPRGDQRRGEKRK